jgi:hypothetical protein
VTKKNQSQRECGRGESNPNSCFISVRTFQTKAAVHRAPDPLVTILLKFCK